ncbi:MAG: hypothetical protein DI564_06155 [Rhodanobacter denitrificans]|uniref:LTXXQ motif family protein n=1 Tax=Rhodanobacter denitrificans TaxID=666685 RepID=A0A2W5MC19_9GAMM|nr:MAG: hypothetical protein DI564_06155 [Rhodanobacter denitrificans]
MSDPLPFRLRLLAFALAVATAAPTHAQGFPGGGPPPAGGAPRRGAAPAAATMRETAAPDPLVRLFAQLRELRSDLMIREDQAEAWTALRDAVRAYVDETTAPRASGAGRADPRRGLRDRATQARQHADALERVVDRLDALADRLDGDQRRRLDARLDALAQAPGAPR